MEREIKKNWIKKNIKKQEIVKTFKVLLLRNDFI